MKNTRFNLYSRSEEEKSRDMIMYETKAAAGELSALFDSRKKKIHAASVIALCVFSAIGYPFFFNAYDKENSNPYTVRYHNKICDEF